MEPHLPFIIYLPGKIQECLPAPSILKAFPPPEVNLTSPKVLYEEPAPDPNKKYNFFDLFVFTSFFIILISIIFH
jgi:hypothetical protein